MMASIDLVIILAIVTQYVDGYQRIVQVSELFSDDKYSFTSSDGDFFVCCVYGNCSCNSLDYALTHLTSNVLINITTDVTLSSLAEVSDLENVLIIGHANPTINCRNFGGMNFTICRNCIIKGIIWDGCGTNEEPGLRLNNSSNITIQNCYFQHSIGQAVVLSEVTGDVNINHCQFVYNSHYRDHGAAVYYSSSNVTNHLQPLFTISNCNFSNNKGAKSLVYIENKISEHADNVMLYYSKFCHNQGTSIYVINQKLSLSGMLLFQNNTAKRGTGIYITLHSTVIFGRNSNVAFIQNSADHEGGAVFVSNHSTVLFDQNSEIRFNYNKSTNGTVYSKTSSNVIFTGTCIVEFSNNTATQYGAAIYSFNNSHVIFTNNSKVTFGNNLIYGKSLHYGGIVYSENCGHISMEDNSSTIFSNNVRGAIVSLRNSNISFQDYSSTTFSNNFASYTGGAIFSYGDSHISFEDSCSTIFGNNSANYGGAILAATNSNISFKDYSSTKFSNNFALIGGAILSYYKSHISFEDNSSTIFGSNTADDEGGAVYSYYNSHIFYKDSHDGGAIYSNGNSHISFKDNSSTVFGNNTADYGGAIFSYDNSHISFIDNSSAIFGNNTADDDGGAISSDDNSHIFFKDSSSTIFGNNTADDKGGAIYTYDNSNVLFQDNSSTTFSNNAAYYGGAICSDLKYSFSAYYDDRHISFVDNSSTIFRSNTAYYGGTIFSNVSGHILFKDYSSTTFNKNNADGPGGAICSYHKGNISFEDDSSTMFNNNVAGYGGAMYSISHIYFKENSTTELNNNTAIYHGGAIRCEISNIYFSEYSTVIFRNNIADYGGAVFAEINSDIIFSDNSTILLTANKATFGATLYSNDNSKIKVNDNSFIIFNDHLAKWCTDTCLPYTGQSDAITIDGNGIVWCSNQKAFVCASIKCYCKKLEDLLKSDGNFSITEEVMTLSSAYQINIDSYFSLIGYKNNTIICTNGGRLLLYGTGHFYTLTIEGINWIGCGDYIYSQTPVILMVIDSLRESNIKIQKCSFQHSLAPAIGYVLTTINLLHVPYTVHNNILINYCSFMNNNLYRGHGVAIHYSSLSSKHIIPNNKFRITNCNFFNNHGISLIYIDQSNQIFFQNMCVYINNSNFYNNQGVPIYLSKYIELHIYGKVSFENNVADNGTGIYINDHSTITFCENSTVKFYNNTAINGTIYSKDSSNVTFRANCEVTFSNNSATQYGAAIYSVDRSHVTFTGISEVTFSSNDASLSKSDADHHFGGIIFSEKNGHVSFEEILLQCFTITLPILVQPYFHLIILISHSKISQG